MKTQALALALLVLMGGFAVSHSGDEENADGVDWHGTHMIAHHGSLNQGIMGHLGTSWGYQNQNTETGDIGCPRWR